MQNIKLYFLTFVVFFLIDIVWLAVISKNIYKQYLGGLMKENINWTAALLFYALFIVGLVFFVINPALAKNSLQYAILAGGLFGLIAYATYDLTNLATLKDWPVFITVIDLIWGTFVCAATSGVSFLLARLWLK